MMLVQKHGGHKNGKIRSRRVMGNMCPLAEKRVIHTGPNGTSNRLSFMQGIYGSIGYGGTSL